MSKSSKKSNATSKAASPGRNWVFVVYEDSLPAGEPYKTLDEQAIPYFLQWHDKDIDPDGTEKKKHGHLLLMFDGNKSPKQMNALKEAWNCPSPKRVENLRSMARYLCHLDNPDKAQYAPETVQEGYGADYRKIISLSEDKYAVVREMMAFVAQEDILYYSDLLEYASLQNDAWFRALLDTSRQTMYEYIKSRAYKQKEEKKEALQMASYRALDDNPANEDKGNE